MFSLYARAAEIAMFTLNRHFPMTFLLTIRARRQRDTSTQNNDIELLIVFYIGETRVSQAR